MSGWSLCSRHGVASGNGIWLGGEHHLYLFLVCKGMDGKWIVLCFFVSFLSSLLSSLTIINERGKEKNQSRKNYPSILFFFSFFPFSPSAYLPAFATVRATVCLFKNVTSFQSKRLHEEGEGEGEGEGKGTGAFEEEEKEGTWWG